MVRAQAGQSVGAQVINATTGAGFAGVVTVYITLDAGVQTIGSVGSGLATNEGNGFYSYLPSAAETDGLVCAYTFTGASAVPATSQYATVTATQIAAVTSSTVSTATTVRRLITAALKRINVIQQNETPDDQAMADAFDRFNDWVDSVLANDRLLIYGITRTTWTIVSGTQTYTVGPSGTINITRPQFISRFNYQNTTFSPVQEYPLVPLTDDEYQLLPIKTLGATLPVYAYYNPLYSSAQGTLTIWPNPTTTTLQGVLYWPSQVTRFNSVDDAIALPPGYNRFMRDNLALELAPEFRDSIPVDRGLVNSASESKRNLKTINLRMTDLGFDLGSGIYNIFSDTTY